MVQQEHVAPAPTRHADPPHDECRSRLTYGSSLAIRQYRGRSGSTQKACAPSDTRLLPELAQRGPTDRGALQFVLGDNSGDTSESCGSVAAFPLEQARGRCPSHRSDGRQRGAPCSPPVTAASTNQQQSHGTGETAGRLLLRGCGQLKREPRSRSCWGDDAEVCALELLLLFLRSKRQSGVIAGKALVCASVKRWWLGR